MNTKVTYLYRDASNYKNTQTYVFRGEITEAGKQSIRDCLSCGELFIPEQMDLIHPWISDELTEDDHCWCELNIDDIKLTKDRPNAPYPVEDLVARFERIGATGWDDVRYAV